MRVFPIYESSRLFSRLSTLTNADANKSDYITFSLDGLDMILTFVNGNPINLRVFNVHKDFVKYVEQLKKSYKNYEYHKQDYLPCKYYPEETAPF